MRLAHILALCLALLAAACYPPPPYGPPGPGFAPWHHAPPPPGPGFGPHRGW